MNIQGLYPKTNQTKIPFLQDLACITETHLNEAILDAEIQLSNYTIYREDRKGRSHGGVCTYVRNDLVATVSYKDSNA